MKLPPEIILQIIDDTIPSSKVPVAFSPSDPITQTLRSWALVCNFTRAKSQYLLLKHCLYIDSHERLKALLDNTSSLVSLPSPGLFLAPFPEDDLDHLDIAQHIDQLCAKVCSSLTRLVIDMPLRRLYPYEDKNRVRPVLRTAFERLTAIEEFCSAQDELYLATMEDSRSEPEVWSLWPGLRRLALYNLAVDTLYFYTNVTRCSALAQLVLVRGDGLTYVMEDEEAEALESWNFGSLRRVAMVNVEYPSGEDMESMTSFYGRLMASRAGEGSRVVPGLYDGIELDMILVDLPEDRQDDEIAVCQEWLRDSAIRGDIWD
ncbi:hypothetical protein EYZ11_000776 [Aspergillus tanneri]|nr:hypothetical protein EYZ11_000776 [Aspergillus tanneri]